MEFERTLFRVHERFLSLPPVRKSVDYCFKASLLILIVSIPIFIYGNARFLNKSPCIMPAIASQYYLDPHNEKNDTTTVDGKPIIRPEDVVIIKIADLSNKNLDLENTAQLYSYFEFSGISQVLLMDPEIRAAHNFTIHNVSVDVSCYTNNILQDLALFVLDYENIVINELIQTFDGFNRIMKNDITNEIWSFSENQVKSLRDENSNVINRVMTRFLGILKLLLGVFLVSNVTAIYNKMTIICAPIFILAAYRFCTHPSQRQMDRMHIYRAFPWIGMYLYTLNNNGRKKDRYIIFAFLCMIVIFYCLYLAALVFWNMLLFNKSFPKGLDENFYGFLALIEFLVLLFIRTRSTIKYFPKMSILIMLMFLFYVQYTPYGFYNMSLFMMSWAILGLLSYFLLHFEIPSLDWNPSYHYTPSIDSPRCLYFPIFSLTWYHDLPQLWTMFFPIFGRSHFSNTELAMVNRNYPLLVTTLENAAQGIRADGDQNQGNNAGNAQGGGFMMQPMGNLPEDNQNAVNEQEAGSPSRVNLSSNINLLGGNLSGNLGSNNAQQNLLQNTDADYVLDVPDGGRDNRRRNTGQNGDNGGNNYRRIDDLP